MKSNQGSGYNGNKQPKDLHERIKDAEKKVEEKNEKTEEENFKEMEEEVHRLLEESAEAKVKKQVNDALTKAKDAAAKERKIRNLREQTGSLDQVNIDLTFYVFYNLANMYHVNGLHQEALNSYTIILKNK